MDTNTFLLFIACLLFSVTGFYWNTQATQKNLLSVVLRFIFLTCGLVGLMIMLVIINKAFGVL